MTEHIQFDGPLKAGVIGADGGNPGDSDLAVVRKFLTQDDELAVLPAMEPANTSDLDIVFFVHVCGSTRLSELAARAGLTVLAVNHYGGFHPYHAAFYRGVEKHGGTVLPADNPEEIAASVQAVRSRKALRGLKLLVADPGKSAFRLEEIRAFTAGCRAKLGLEIVLCSTDEIKDRARRYTEKDADEVLARWYDNILEGPGEMDADHMRQVARLYLAQVDILKETGAVGITPQDIGAFLLDEPSEVMPNVSYGPLVCDGYLVAEEADIEVLTTELLLYAGLGAQPTMSNVYYAYRDRFDAIGGSDGYTQEMELADCMQCFEDNHVVAAHFSASGVLPPGMMEEKRYRVREALPSWPGQSMIVSTPKPGKVLLARLADDASGIHLVPGTVDGLGLGDQYGWYRGRWFIEVPDAKEFAAECLHQHYAIGPDPGRRQALDILCRLCGLFQ